jgi:acyl dehydratase/NAD(P)-dependent dehydrogenase (short-subunit alcohol dehydrogenase family)
VTTASFTVDIDATAAAAFAVLSGDHNPLHTDAAYAATTAYGRPVLHGAFSAGLLSRMAGMHLPGRACLLHALRLRFLAPIVPPVRVVVDGRVSSGTLQQGQVDVTVRDAATGRRYVEGSYDFGTHETLDAVPVSSSVSSEEVPGPDASSDPVVLVTGARGALGRAVLARLGARGRGLSRTSGDGLWPMHDHAALVAALGRRPIAGILHLAWPEPDNTRLIALDDAGSAVDHHVCAPLAEAIRLARLLTTHGAPGAPLILAGSTAADPGRHNYRMPLYSLGKSLVPTLARVLAVELAPTGHRCVAATFDVLDGGMNATMSKGARIAHTARIPAGTVPTMDDAAGQVLWLLDNRSPMLSGATVTLSGGALP